MCFHSEEITKSRDAGVERRLLRVNLSERRVTVEEIPFDLYLLLGGGRGLASWYLYRETPKGIEALGEENRVIFATGVLAATPVQACSRWVVISKSPLTNGFGRACAGGDFGAWMKFSGYDLILVEGCAEKPVYVHITPEGGRICDASDLWGKTTAEVQEELIRRHGRRTRVACIGPAGENLVRFAAVLSGRRSASRCGIGAVMGFKKLKAVAITAERQKVRVHDPVGLASLARQQVQIFKSSKQFWKHKEYGTTDGAIWMNELAAYPVRNFRFGRLDNYELLGPDRFKGLRVKDVGCYRCLARCGKVHRVPSGPYEGAESEGPEYESYWAFSGPVDQTDIGATIMADSLCDQLGLDTISTGGVIGFAFELFERGILTEKDTDGLILEYGNHGAMIDLIRKIAFRQGIGGILAEGTLRAARLLGKGTEYYAMQSKGLELSGYDPRGRKVTGFGYATNLIGGSHTNGALAMQEVGLEIPRSVDRFCEEKVADIVIYNQNLAALREIGIVCAFAMGWGNWFHQLFNHMLFKATGVAEFLDWEVLAKIGERIWNLERAFLVREGFSRKDDSLPERVQKEPLRTKGGPGEGEVVRTLDAFLDEYYALRGWTPEGVPTPQKLKELGLDWIAKDLEQHVRDITDV